MTPMLPGLALILVGVVVGSWGVSRIIRTRRPKGARVFRFLADGLKLAAAERRLLGRVARLTGVRSPSVLVISVGCFDRASAQFARRHGRQRQLAAIRRKVFGTP